LGSSPTPPARIFNDRVSLDCEPAGEPVEIGNVRPHLLVGLPASEFPPKDFLEPVLDDLLDLVRIVADRDETERPFGELGAAFYGLVCDSTGFQQP